MDKPFYINNPTLKFKKGEIILRPNDTPEYAYCVKSGVIEEFNINEMGTVQSISFATRGAFFPICWTALRAPRTVFFYGAHTNVEVCLVDRDRIIEEVNSNIEFSKKYIASLAKDLMYSKLSVGALEQPTARLKLLHTFRSLYIGYGEFLTSNIVKIMVPLTQQKLAENTGLSRETVSLEVNKLKAEEVIIENHKTYKVDIEKLDHAMEDGLGQETMISQPFGEVKVSL